MPHSFEFCPKCNSPLVKAIAFSGVESEYWYECTRCNTYVNSYMPQPHQEALHRDNHKYIGNFGGYGTGKTTTSREEIYKHVFLTPRANVLVGANVASQYEQTIKREIENDIPAALVKYYSTQKSYMDLFNGARILYRPLADAEKLRSFNLTMFVIVEASETPIESFAQLKTRSRNMRAARQRMDSFGRPVYKRDSNGREIPEYSHVWIRGIIESNPDSGWIKSEVLQVADEVHTYGNVLENFVQNPETKDRFISAHVASTEVNQYLPEDFVEQITKNKPAWWVSRYVFGSFSYSEGLVYPTAVDSVIPDTVIPKFWRRLISFDYGLHDDAVFLFGAISIDDGLLHIYREVRVNNQNVERLAQLYFDNSKDIPSGGLYTAPLIDPKSAAKRDYDKKTLGDHFLEHGIAFQPGFVNVNARVFRLNTYFETKRVVIHESCAGLIGELKEYAFKPKSLERSVGEDKPVDKNNHAINALEWIVMALPANPRDTLFAVYNSSGVDISRLKRENSGANRLWQLSDEDETKLYEEAHYFRSF